MILLSSVKQLVKCLAVLVLGMTHPHHHVAVRGTILLLLASLVRGTMTVQSSLAQAGLAVQIAHRAGQTVLAQATAQAVRIGNMTRESLTMIAVGVISAFHGTTHYLETQRLDFMSVVMGTLSVLYFISLVYEKRKKCL